MNFTPSSTGLSSYVLATGAEFHIVSCPLPLPLTDVILPPTGILLYVVPFIVTSNGPTPTAEDSIRSKPWLLQLGVLLIVAEVEEQSRTGGTSTGGIGSFGTCGRLSSSTVMSFKE